MAKRSARKRKTRPDVPGANGAAGDGPPKPGDNSRNAAPEADPLTEDQRKALFVSHRDKLDALLKKQRSATSDVRNQRKRIKADGFAVDQVEDAIAMLTPEGEADVRGAIERKLQAARWVGASWGNVIFDQHGPSMADPFEEGRIAGAQGLTRKPPYSPESEQHERWMEGYYKGQEALQAGVGRGPDPLASPVGAGA